MYVHGLLSTHACTYTTESAREHFASGGLSQLRAGEAFVPHLTIANIHYIQNKKDWAELGNKIPQHSYAAFLEEEFGELVIKELELLPAYTVRPDPLAKYLFVKEDRPASPPSIPSSSSNELDTAPTMELPEEPCPPKQQYLPPKDDDDDDDTG